jgi:ABC-type sugar transport system permease subunit
MKSDYVKLVLPAVIFMSIFFVYPLFNTFLWSFYDFSPFRRVYNFVGLQNYFKVTSTDLFRTGVINTVVWVPLVAGLGTFIALAGGLVTYTKFKGSKIFRALFTMPIVLIPSGVGIMWALMFSDPFGLVNHILAFLGVETRPWLAIPSFTIYLVAITEIWFDVPMLYLMLTAGLESLPSAPLEAAEIDGASNIKKTWHVILPLLRPILSIVFLLTSIDSFRRFAMIWIMTQGGPGIASATLSVVAYKEMFQLWEYGMGSAISVILVLIALAFSIVYMRRIKI